MSALVASLRLSSLALLAGSVASAAACASPGKSDAAGDDGGSQSSSSGSSSSSSGSGSGSGSSGGMDATSPGSDAQGGGPADAKNDGGSQVSADAGSEASAPAEAGVTGFVCPAGPFPAPVLTGLTPTRVAGVPPSDSFNNNNNNFGIIEGPVWIGDSLYVSEIASGNNPPPSRILKVTQAGVVTIAVADSGSNGLAVDGAGNLYGAVHKDGSIDRFDLTSGAPTALATGYGDAGTRFNSPNDLAVRSSGDIYFSDPNYQAPSPQPQSITGLYRVAAGTHAVTLLDGMLQQPNGVTLSLDESTLFVTSNNGLYRYPVMSNGTVGSGVQVTSSINGDGMVMDCAGNLYVAATNTSNVLVLGPTGTQIGMISLPSGAVQAVSNVAFGGADHKTLYITGLGNTKGLYQVAMNLPGMPY